MGSHLFSENELRRAAAMSGHQQTGPGTAMVGPGVFRHRIALQQGDIMVMDIRLLHHGTANTAEQPRTLLYQPHQISTATVISVIWRVLHDARMPCASPLVLWPATVTRQVYPVRERFLHRSWKLPRQADPVGSRTAGATVCCGRCGLESGLESETSGKGRV